MLLAVFALGALFGARSFLEARAPDAPTPDGASSPAADMRSPFAPWTGLDSDPRAAAARIAGVRLAGVRLATAPARSGAIFTLEDGAQRAFAVGHEIAPGVRLAAIYPGSVALEFDGAHLQQMALPGYAPGAAATALAALPSPSQAAAPAEAAAWLATVLMRPEETVGEPYGWRVKAPVPPQAAAAGLRTGDLILAVNGVAPSAGAVTLGASEVELSVLRSDGERLTITFSPDRRA